MEMERQRERESSYLSGRKREQLRERETEMKYTDNVTFVRQCRQRLIFIAHIVVVVILLFYVHSKRLWSCRNGQLTLDRLLPVTGNCT